jgi:hypothetical protein
MTADPALAPATLPPELLGSVPREVRLTGGGIALLAVASAFAFAAPVAAIVMLIVNARMDLRRELRDRGSVSVEADVVDVTLRRGEHPRHVVTYRYEHDGRSYTARITLGEKDRRDVARGSSLRIEYLPSNPQESWIAGERPAGIPLWVLPLVALPLLVSAAAIGWSVRRQWILLSEGRAARARVVGVKNVLRDHHRAFRVSYEFRTLSGAKQTSRCEVSKPVPQIGTFIPIVYHRDQPAWSAKYPLQFVRPRSRSGWVAKSCGVRL